MFEKEAIMHAFEATIDGKNVQEEYTSLLIGRKQLTTKDSEVEK